MGRFDKSLLSLLLLAFTATSYAIDLRKISINGYSSFEFEKQIEGKGKGAGDPNFSFDADLFDLVFNFQVEERIRVATDLTWEHGPATEDNRGNVAVEYAFLEYAFSDLFKVRVGKMFTPFGIFNEIHTAKPAFLSAKEASSTNKTGRIVKAGFRFFPRWGTGIAFQGDGVLGGKNFNYDVLLANGEQETTNPFEKDVDPFKSVTARIRVELTDHLLIGNSFYFDNITEPGFKRLVSEGVQVDYIWKQVRVLTEVVAGFKTRDNGSTVKQIGWFMQPSYHFENGVTPYMRLEHLDPNLTLGKDSGIDLIIGVNLEFSKAFMVKVENNYFRGGRQSSLAKFPGRDYNEIKAAVVIGF